METFTGKYRKLLEANHMLPKPELDMDDLMSNLQKNMKSQPELVLISVNGEVVKPYLELLSGISTILCQLMLSRDDSEKIKILRALDVLSDISDFSRDCLFKQAVVIPLVDLLNNSPSEELIPAVLKTYKNLGSENILTHHFADKYCFGLPVISQFIFHRNQNIVADTIAILGYIASCYCHHRILDKHDEVVIGRTAAKIVTEKLSSCDHPLHEIALDAVSYLAYLNEEQNQILLECGILTYIGETLKCDIPEHRKLSLWTLADLLCYVTSEQIAFIQETQILSYLIHEILDKDNTDPKTVEYSLWSIQNLTCSATSEQIAKLVSDGCIEALCKYLTLENNANILFLALDALGNILPHGDVLSEYKERINLFIEILISSDGEKLLEDIRNCFDLDFKIRSAAIDILVYYIPGIE